VTAGWREALDEINDRLAHSHALLINVRDIQIHDFGSYNHSRIEALLSFG
jgi:hypothetical protein